MKYIKIKAIKKISISLIEKQIKEFSKQPLKFEPFEDAPKYNQYSKYKTPNDFAGQCGNLIEAFGNFLKDKKIFEDDTFFQSVHLKKDILKHAKKNSKDVCLNHVILKIGDYYVDLSPMQFYFTKKKYLILTKSEAKKYYTDFERLISFKTRKPVKDSKNLY